jgi:hypothetical protein
MTKILILNIVMLLKEEKGKLLNLLYYNLLCKDKNNPGCDYKNNKSYAFIKESILTKTGKHI